MLISLRGNIYGCLLKCLASSSKMLNSLKLKFQIFEITSKHKHEPSLFLSIPWYLSYISLNVNRKIKSLNTYYFLAISNEGLWLFFFIMLWSAHWLLTSSFNYFLYEANSWFSIINTKDCLKHSSLMNLKTLYHFIMSNRMFIGKNSSISPI